MKSILSHLPRLLLLLLFTYAAISKLADFQVFRAELYNQSFSHQLADLLRYLLPSLELLTVAMLLIPRTEKAGLWMSLVLLLLFTGYISMVLWGYWERTPCSCGGVLSKLTWRSHLIFNIFFIIVNTLALLIRDQQADQP